MVNSLGSFSFDSVYKPNNSDVCYHDIQQKEMLFCHPNIMLRTKYSRVFSNVMSTDLFFVRCSTHGALKLHFWDLLTGKPFLISLNSAHSGCDITD